MIQISYEQVKNLLTVEELFEPIKQAFVAYNSSKIIGVPVNLLHFPNGSDTHIKIAALKGYDYFSIKVVSMFPENVKLNLSPYSGAIFLFDAKTGFPTATINDKGIITDLRTAAAGALITDFIASKDASSVTVIGTGLQAFHQVVALNKLRKIYQLIICGRSMDKALLLKQKLAILNPNISIETVSEPEYAVKKSEIIITTTSSKNPLVRGEWLQKGQHVTAVGADDIYKNEIDSDCFDCADFVFVDSLELNKKYGEYSHAIRTTPDLQKRTIEFGQAFKDETYTDNRDKITVAKLVGVGIQDLAAAIVLINKMRDKI